MITEVFKTAVSHSELEALVNDGETILLREKLGLPSVEKISHFRLLTEEEARVYKHLFPQDTPISRYHDFIPVEALQALDDAINNCAYPKQSEARVWHAKTYDPDPVMLLPVRFSDTQYTWPDGHLLIARWGDALEPFEVLAKKAFEKWKAERLRQLALIKHKLAGEFEALSQATAIYSNNDPSLSI